DDGCSARFAVMLERRQGAAPFERTEIVRVLALEQHAPPGRERRRSALERRRRGHLRRVSSMPAVQLFATCLGGLLFPEAVADAEALLREAGFEVEFPRAQVCCGQPAFNAGHRRAARRVARTFARAFSRETPIVAPSGSCATMASHYLPEL